MRYIVNLISIDCRLGWLIISNGGTCEAHFAKVRIGAGLFEQTPGRADRYRNGKVVINFARSVVGRLYSVGWWRTRSCCDKVHLESDRILRGVHLITNFRSTTRTAGIDCIYVAPPAAAASNCPRGILHILIYYTLHTARFILIGSRIGVCLPVAALWQYVSSTFTKHSLNTYDP
jgi:hypothetical protein